MSKIQRTLTPFFWKIIVHQRNGLSINKKPFKKEEVKQAIEVFERKGYD